LADDGAAAALADTRHAATPPAEVNQAVAPRAAPGRSCPSSYGYSPRALARPADFATDILYVIGGLYGNVEALDVIERLAAQEAVEPTLVFNGDFHWFDADASLYAEIQHRVLRHRPLRGNVETEIAADDSSAGCGCAYPESVPDADVERSNAILARLRGVAASVAGSRTVLGTLPMHAVAQVGGARIGVVHGDAWSLAGWRFAHDQLHAITPDASSDLAGAFELAAVDGFASSHTCAPALKCTERGFVINNGSAGMANFAGTTHGVFTRIAARPLPRALEPLRLYGLHDSVGGCGLVVDALRVDFELAAWLDRFDTIWPSGSPAAVSYRQRLAAGPGFTIAQALGHVAASCGT
jgi:hypothetical protein